MANLKDIKNQPVKITLTDGVERTLRFTLNAMAELEDKYGSVDAAFAKLDEGSIKAVRFILWAGLMHEDPNLTEQQVGNLIDIQYLQELMNSVENALDSDLPQQEEPAKLPDGNTSDPNA